jgi:glycosyltransferase involved in cell wall biosynthesis
MQDPRVSIVIPCYNIAGRFGLLEEAITSLCHQTLTDWEAVLVDDGSSDGTDGRISRLIRRLPDRRISLIRLPQNGGTSLARNAGIEASQGVYLAFLDYDDLYLPAYLARCVSIFEARPDTHVIFSVSYNRIELAGRVRVGKSPVAAGLNTASWEAFAAYFIERCFDLPIGSGIICRRKGLLNDPNIRFSTFLSRKTAEDVEFAYQLLKRGFRPYILEEPGLIARLFLPSRSRRSEAEFACDHLAVNEYILREAVEPLLRSIRPRLAPEITARIDRSLERRMTLFRMQSHFFAGKPIRALRTIARRPSLYRYWLRLLLLGFARRNGTLAFLRDNYLFEREPDDPASRRAVSAYLAEIREAPGLRSAAAGERTGPS